MLITPEYLELQKQLHQDKPEYGTNAHYRAPIILSLAQQIGTHNILDYGCGKGSLARIIPYPIHEYDPAIEGKDKLPEPADFVVCLDMLEHIEPECIEQVLDDLKRVVKKMGYFVVCIVPAEKILRDGRNAHILLKEDTWWTEKLASRFHIRQLIHEYNNVHYLVERIDGIEKTNLAY